MRKRFTLLLSLSASVFAPNVGAARQQPADLRIDVVRHATGDTWSATYELTEPATMLRFANNTNLFRTGAWEVATDGVELVVHDGFEVIRASDGALFERVKISVPHQPQHLDRDYEFHVPFTDGSVLLYTGHFEVQTDAGPLTTNLSLSGRDGEHIYIHGAAYDEVTVRYERDGFGTYAYFGNAEPIETDDVVALIDPGLPQWIREENERYLPQLFALYTERLGFKLDSRPMVFFSYIEGVDGMSNFSGGALNGMIQMTVMGRDWAERKGSESFERLIAFLAHESVHLWNRPSGRGAIAPGSAWMHEGGADALSFSALAELGVTDRAGVLMRHERALKQAATRLVGASVRESGTPELSMNFYQAGSALALATELAVQQANPELDLFDFWRELLTAARTNGSTYQEADYYALADRMAPGSGIGERLRAFVETRHEEPVAAFIHLFAPFEEVRVDLDWDSGELILEPADG